jgi:hypothetical protein
MCVKVCMLSPERCYYYRLPLYRPAANAVQMEAPVPEIIDAPSYAIFTNLQTLFPDWFVKIRVGLFVLF